MRWRVKSEHDLATVAQHAHHALSAGDVLLLQGEMGAGKTTFVRYLAQAMQLNDAIHSPTYTLCNTYGEGRLLHLDLYRLGSERDVAAMDMERILETKTAIVVIEWPERLGRFTPTNAHRLSIEMGDGDARTFVWSDPQT
ncbi:MAG: tRNA (adenosine(37)-N6)-threonylcarbamoyltransferase complex ATPase subunit type 1 TsaE [bacterium]|nr:tRNA (adenosine(37)-N6)-threonylcarbamoyltransferase complex ATPase subunit type 1 TsaE [bacterium]